MVLRSVNRAGMEMSVLVLLRAQAKDKVSPISHKAAVSYDSFMALIWSQMMFSAVIVGSIVSSVDLSQSMTGAVCAHVVKV